MEKLKYNKAFRDGIIAIIFCVLLAAAFIVPPIIAKIQYNNLVSSMKSVEATIVDIDLDINVRGPDEQEIYITYKVDGVVYNRELSTDTKIAFAAGTGTDYSVGDRLDIFYNPQNPNEIATPLSVKAGNIYIVIGLAFLALVMVALILMLKKRKNFLVTKEEYEREKRKRKNSELLNKSGKKIRWQYFNTFIYIMLAIMPVAPVMIIILELKKGNVDIWGVIAEMAGALDVVLALYAIFIGPFIVLSILNRFCFGKVLGVVDNTTLSLNERDIDINNIVEIVYHPRVMSRSSLSFCSATFTLQTKNGGTQSFEVMHFPLYGLKLIKKYNLNVKLSCDKYIWFLVLCPAVVSAVLALLMG